MLEQGAIYTREVNTDTNQPYEIKFAKLIDLCVEAEQAKLSILTVYSPNVLGDTYHEIVQSLDLIAQHKLKVLFVSPDDRSNQEQAQMPAWGSTKLPLPKLPKHGFKDREELIEAYLKDVLTVQLQALGLAAKPLEKVIIDVQWRLASLSDIWGDAELRRTALLAGREEAVFYEPSGVRIDLRAAVVVTVRNSILEDLTTGHPFIADFQAITPCLNDQQVPQITRAAIEALRPWLTLPASPHSMVEESNNLWVQLRQRFPRAWRRMHLLATGEHKGEILDNDDLADTSLLDATLPELTTGVAGKPSPNGIIVASGYDPRIDPGLLGVLQKVQQVQQSTLQTPSFKWLTRNPEKLYRVFEGVLLMNRPIVTGNYFIAPNQVEARNPLLRPPHSESEIAPMFKNPRGLSRLHRETLAQLGW